MLVQKHPQRVRFSRPVREGEVFEDLPQLPAMLISAVPRLAEGGSVLADRPGQASEASR
ncbi:hypothetical protein AB0B15_36760 [Streptomyces sp. NPDC045456]|uniref:hypothetical protein n=1 Tax=Streptomyces sp. NPDC045456 TaxID=3155254 RepID=UPI0033FAF64F